MFINKIINQSSQRKKNSCARKSFETFKNKNSSFYFFVIPLNCVIVMFYTTFLVFNWNSKNKLCNSPEQNIENGSVRFASITNKNDQLSFPFLFFLFSRIRFKNLLITDFFDMRKKMFYRNQIFFLDEKFR